MANPKKRKTRSKNRMGRAHLALEKVSLTKCSKCGEPRLPHTACSNCGTYKSKQVVKPRLSSKK